jgi:hypothetical protein
MLPPPGSGPIQMSEGLIHLTLVRECECDRGWSLALIGFDYESWSSACSG